MKTKKMVTKTLLMLIVVGSSYVSMAQTSGNGNVISKTFDVKSFNKISASGAYDVILTQSAEQSVVIKVDENLMSRIEVKVVDGELCLSSKSMQNPTKLIAEISMPALKSIESSGASDVKTTNKFSGSEIEIEASGASEIYFTGDYAKMEINLSGASDVTIVGKGNMLEADISGASDLKASDYKVDNASIEASGASDATVNVKGNLEMNESGASEIRNSQKSKK